MKKNLCQWLLMAALLLLLSGCHDDDSLDIPVVDGSAIDTLNIDVVLPANIRQSWQNAIDWATENISTAQQQRRNRVLLRLRYHDENVENLDSLAHRLANPQAGDDTCHAIIGPYRSDNAQTFLSHAAKTRLPVVMPTCASADLQRINARNTYAWFLTESDVTQCEMMLMAAHASRAQDVVLVYADDTYGRSFYDWFGYFATELAINIAGDGAVAYQKGMDLIPFLNKAKADATGEKMVVLMALSDATDYYNIIQQVYSFKNQWLNEHGVYPACDVICSDTSLDDLIVNPGGYRLFDYGISPCGNMQFGFPLDYESRYGRRPYNGEAQIYEALTIIALGAAQRLASPTTCLVDGKPAVDGTGQPLLTDYMRSVVSSTEGMTCHWNLTGMAGSFRELEAGRTIDLSGATGSLYFDETTRTQILNTTYMLWMLRWMFSLDDDPVSEVFPLLYLSTTGTGSDMSTTALWKSEKNRWQAFVTNEESHQLPDVSDHWAVVISPSTSWENYRHQADAFAMYQTLRQHGYDDDHIVLIVEDNLANDLRNIHPGQIFVEFSGNAGDDVRKDAVVDYHFSQLTPDDVADIMLGRQSARLPQVLHTDSTSNVFVFWSSHGGSLEGPLWGNEDSHQYFGTQRIRDIVSQMNDNDQYRRMMFAVETCYSGKWGGALEGLPDMLVLTAANPHETSKADVFDNDLGVFLSNAFARTFRKVIGKNPAVSIYDLYRELARTTTGSHVTIYNNTQYGSVYDDTMTDYFPQ